MQRVFLSTSSRCSFGGRALGLVCFPECYGSHKALNLQAKRVKNYTLPHPPKAIRKGRRSGIHLCRPIAISLRWYTPLPYCAESIFVRLLWRLLWRVPPTLNLLPTRAGKFVLNAMTEMRRPRVEIIKEYAETTCLLMVQPAMVTLKIGLAAPCSLPALALVDSLPAHI